MDALRGPRAPTLGMEAREPRLVAFPRTLGRLAGAIIRGASIASFERSLELVWIVGLDLRWSVGDLGATAASNDGDAHNSNEKDRLALTHRYS